MSKTKKNWLYRALCAALAVTLVSGAAVMTPVADFIGTSINANAVENVITQGDYWTACKISENQCSVALKGKLTGMSGDTSTGAVKLDWESILSAIGSDYTITEISAEEGTEFVGNGKQMFNAQRKNWESNKLDTVKKIDLSNVNTSQMTDMSYFFCYCTGLEELNISSFDTSNTTSMGFMFYHCHSLKSLDLANFDTSKVTSVPYMFTECQSLESINLSSFDTSKFDALSAWFDGCKKLTVIDMSNFSTPLVEYTQQMFRNCTSLKTVFVGSGWTTEKVSTDKDMFTNTTAIVGGADTVWDSSNPVNKTYAKVDGGTDNPGYLTGKYTVTWKNDNDTILETGKFVNGTAPVYDGETPAKDGYVFTGWKDENNTFYANGTALPNITADTTYTAVFEKTLAVGTEYYIGDILNTNGYKDVLYDNRYTSTYSLKSSIVVPTPTYRKAENYWYFADMIRSGWGFTMADNAFSGTETVIGFRCVSGDGSSSNTAFKFDLIYENETDTCEMDFSDVAESLVSIKDADENTVALNNGKAAIKTGYVITSSSPLSFPRTYAVQQTDENNFVYVIKNMIQSEKKVAYDTSAFKGTVTAYEGYGGVIVNGYEGTSVQQFSRTPYYKQSVTVDFSHGTMLTGRNEYYDAPLDEFFDIYNADGENITDLFEFSNLAGSYYNYYYYKLKQNLETDISVFPTGTKFSLTLPEGVTIENADDVVTAQDGNKYTIRPVATAILVSDSLLSVLNSNASLSVRPDTFKKVVNGKYVYEVKVITEYVVSKSNIITTQEQFDNAKAGDILMPAETLDVGTAGYNNLEYGEYFNTDGRYWSGSGSGISLNINTTATIDDTLSIKINGSHRAYPVNVGKHENESDYSVEEDKGNAWLIVRSKKEENDYWKTVELTGFNLDLPDYQFNWADDNSTATVTFNNGEPADADVTREADSANSQWVYSI